MVGLLLLLCGLSVSAGHFHPYHGYHHKCSREIVTVTKPFCRLEFEKTCKREAHAPVECEKETKEICKKVPIKEDITKDIEFCKGTPKKVCEDKEVKIPKITCEEPEEEAAAEE